MPGKPTEKKRGRGRPRKLPPRDEGRTVIFVQVPDGLKAAVQASADEQRRTLTAHVTWILEEAMKAEGRGF